MSVTVSYCSKSCAKADNNHKKDCTDLAHISRAYSLPSFMPCDDLPPPKEEKVDMQYSFVTERLSYSKTLLHALQSLPELRLGRNHSSLENLATLDVHVVTSSPLFASRSWEVCFMHTLPKLKQLNVVFIMQGKAFMPSFKIHAQVLHQDLMTSTIVCL